MYRDTTSGFIFDNWHSRRALLFQMTGRLATGVTIGHLGSTPTASPCCPSIWRRKACRSRLHSNGSARFSIDSDCLDWRRRARHRRPGSPREPRRSSDRAAIHLRVTPRDGPCRVGAPVRMLMSLREDAELHVRPRDLLNGVEKRGDAQVWHPFVARFDVDQFVIGRDHRFLEP